MIILIDNYDSFTCNLMQMLKDYEPDIRIIRNDEKTADEIIAMKPDGLVISPGPGKPEDAGIIVELIEKAAGRFPILGICLGHQAMALARKGKIIHACRLMHGKSDLIRLIEKSRLFEGLDSTMTAGRYHSLSVDPETEMENMKITALADDGTIMAMENTEQNLFGLQFHPESILTPQGSLILKNFVALTTGKGKDHD